MHALPEAWANKVLKELLARVDDPRRTRALGFCVSVEHAQFMARVFRDAGTAARAIWADSSGEDRRGGVA